MALKKEHIEKLATLAKIKPEDLTAAIAAEAETDIAIPEGLHAMTDAEIETIKTNTKKGAGEAAIEIAVKEVKQKLGLDFQGKTIEGLAEAVTKKALADAKIEPEKKVQELTDKLATLQNTVKEYESKIAEKDAEVTRVKVTGEVIRFIPDFGENAPALGKDEVLQLMTANGYGFELKDGKVVATKDGKAVEDKLANPVAVKDVVTEFLKAKKLITEEPAPPGGRGQQQKGPAGKFGTLSELQKHFESQGKSVLGSEFMDAVAQAQKDNPEFALDK